MPEQRVGLLALLHGKSQGGITHSNAQAVLGKTWRRVDQIIRELVFVGILEKAGKVGHEDLYVPRPQFNDILRAPMDELDHLSDIVLYDGDK
jgi:hypothetical protein